MSGVAVVWYLLKTNSPVLAVVPATRIMAGDVPLNATMPAISITQVSSMPMNMVSGANAMNTERVQVTALLKTANATPAGAGYPGMRSLLKLIVAACANTRGTVNGVHVDSVLQDMQGPDFFDEEFNLVCGSVDLIVRWTP